MIIHGYLPRTTRTDLLEAERPCCIDTDRCRTCRARLDEVRAARRDAVLMRVAAVRPRRPLH
ncbi:MAG: hypothetical protein LT071_03455 [Nocardioides sp.]|nr:hypothetical protein [Nocardioides sp.]